MIISLDAEKAVYKNPISLLDKSPGELKDIGDRSQIST